MTAFPSDSKVSLMSRPVGSGTPNTRMRSSGAASFGGGSASGLAAGLGRAAAVRWGCERADGSLRGLALSWVVRRGAGGGRGGGAASAGSTSQGIRQTRPGFRRRLGRNDRALGRSRGGLRLGRRRGRSDGVRRLSGDRGNDRGRRLGGHQIGDAVFDLGPVLDCGEADFAPRRRLGLGHQPDRPGGDAGEARRAERDLKRRESRLARDALVRSRACAGLRRIDGGGRHRGGSLQHGDRGTQPNLTNRARRCRALRASVKAAGGSVQEAQSASHGFSAFLRQPASPGGAQATQGPRPACKGPDRREPIHNPGMLQKSRIGAAIPSPFPRRPERSRTDPRAWKETRNHAARKPC